MMVDLDLIEGWIPITILVLNYSARETDPDGDGFGWVKLI